MMDEQDRPKPCVECEHYRFWTHAKGAHCARRSAFDIVDGDMVDIRSCHVERSGAFLFWGRDRCGPEGRYWEARRPATPPHGSSGGMPPPTNR